jgi:lipoprotein-anchoring transpeptidase ErfK/SrfK
MYSSSSLFLILAAAIALCSVDAWTATSSASSFGGRSLATSSAASKVVIVQNGSSMEMKKGKSNVPPAMRGQYERQKEMSQMQQQMMAASKPGSDGFPVFNLFVRTKTQKVRLVLSMMFHE